MPLQQMTEQEIKAAVKNLDLGLAMLLSENGVSPHVQAVLAAAGLKTVATFQRIGTSEAGVKDACAFIGLKADSLPEMIQIGGLQAAWESAKAVREATNKAKAEKTVMRLPQTLKKKSDSNQIQKAYERTHGRQENNRIPGIVIIERMELEIGSGEFVAPR